MKVYTVMVQKPRGLPGVLARASLEIMPGLKGWRPEESDDGKTSAMVLIFATVPHAEKATARLFARGWQVGEYVMNADIDLKAQRLYVHDPVGGWDSVDPARVEYGEDGKPKHCWDYLRSKREAEWPEGKAVPDELKRNLNS